MASAFDVLFRDGVVPHALRGVLLDFRWDLDRLLSLDLPLTDLTVRDFVWLLNLPFWRKDGEMFALTPNEVRARRDEHVEQWERTMRADLDAPVHIAERSGRLVILDGIHRLLKADVVGRHSIPARQVPESVLPLIAADQ